MPIKIITKVKEKVKNLVCPPATQDLELNTKNRDAAIESDHVQYGPMNLEDEAYWDKLADHWKTTPDVAKESNCSNCAAFDISPRMKECMPGSVQKDGELGYCWMHHFKCHSARTCYTWAAGGPITDDEVSEEWQEKNKESLDEKKKKKQQKGKKRAAKTAKRKKKKQTKAKKADRCTRIAKRKYDVWPSAYASGAVVKCRRGKIWKGLKESGVISEETEESLFDKIKDALEKEGGAAGMDALEKHTDAEKSDVEDTIEKEDDLKVHTHGDIILIDKSIREIIKKIDGKYVVYPKSGGARLGTHDTEDDAKKQLAAIEISKQKSEEIDLEEDSLDEKKKKKAKTDYSKEKKSGLHGWFSRQGGKGGSKGWVDCNTCRKNKKTGRKKCKSCGRQKGEKRAKYPSCRPTPSACGTTGKGKKWGKKSEGLQMHINEGVGVDRNLFRPGSDAFFALFREARELYLEGEYTPLSKYEKDLLENSDLGEVVTINGEKIPLEFPMLNEEVLDEKKKKKKDPPIGKPTKNSGGGKKYKVYVRNPKTGNIKKITYGDSKGGLKGNWNNAEARKSFAARHSCAEKSKKSNRRLTAGYWACRAHKDFGTNVSGRFW